MINKADITRADLERMRRWADAKLAAGEEPPWAWYQYMKLRETLDAILAGMAVTRPMLTAVGTPPAIPTHLPI